MSLLAPLIRLSPLPFSSLPAHPALDNHNHDNNNNNNNNNENNGAEFNFKSFSSRPHLHSFLHSVLSEAETFITSTIPQTFKVDRKLRAAPPATAQVQLSTRVIHAQDSFPPASESSRDEFWICRRSVHDDAAREGTASWDEFESGLRENHSENEMKYTPTVSSVERLLEWKTQEEILEGGCWTKVEMHVNMITHTFQPKFLISPRTFISLVISAFRPATSSNSNKGFVVIQIPLTCEPPHSIAPSLREKITSSAPKNTVFAHYASVEWVTKMSSGTKDNHLTPRDDREEDSAHRSQSDRMDHGNDVGCRGRDSSVDTAQLDIGWSAQGGCGGCGVVYGVDGAESIIDHTATND